MNSKGRWIAISIAVLIAVGLITLFLINSRQEVSDDLIVRVGYKPNSGYQNYFVALTQHFFKKHGVTVKGTTFQSTNQMLQALALDQIDATPAGSIEVAARMAQAAPDAMHIYLTLVFHKENAFFSVLVPKGSPLKTLADLKGKKVGTLPGSTASAWFKICVKNFFDPNEVEMLQVSPQLQLQALSAEEVDALYTVDPIVTMAQVKGIAEVMMKGPENDYILNPMATGAGLVSTSFLKDKPETARRFIAAMYEAIDFMRSNEKQTRKIIATETKLDVAVADKMDLIGYWKFDETNYEIVQKYLDFLLDNGILDKRIDAKSLYISQDVMQQ
jgi:NitT/TauT family transport system substrate-binding protein